MEGGGLTFLAPDGNQALSLLAADPHGARREPKGNHNMLILYML